MANFNLGQKALEYDNVGIGIGINASFNAKKRLQFLTEASIDRFWGDKVLIIDENGRPIGSTKINSLKIGPQFFIKNQLAISATYGPAWHAIRDRNYTTGYGYSLALTGLLGAKKRWITKLNFVNISRPYSNIQYIGLSVGGRIF